MKNITLQTTINEILNKSIIPTRIYKSMLGENFCIEIETKEPINYTSILYKKEKDRDADFLILDEKVFAMLPFNPNARL